VRINVAVPEAHVSAPVLNAALESVTRLNESMLERGEIPTFQQGLHHGVKWKPEPPGQEFFDHAKVVLGRKWGDCDDLAPWHAATLRHTGEDQGAMAIARRSGPQRWHAVVQRSDGTIDDPSKRAGMGSHKGIVGSGVVPLMYEPVSVVGGAYMLRPQIALRPRKGGFEARADLPWYYQDHQMEDKPTATDYAMTALHMAPTAATALTGAIDGVCELGLCAGFASEQDLHRLSAIADVCSGAPLDYVREIYGTEDMEAAKHIVGSFWSALKSVASPVVSVARQGIKFIPGIGPVATHVIDTAEAQLQRIPGHAASEPARPGGGRQGLHCTFF